MRVGIDPMLRVSRIENHDEAYHVWQAAGVSQRVLVHLDAHPDLEWVEEGGLVNIANFICPAIRHHLVSEVYWIVPDPSWNTPPLRAALIRYVRSLQSRYPGPEPDDRKRGSKRCDR